MSAEPAAPPPVSASRVACLGVGAMGAPIALNLLKHGHEVHVWNRTAARAEPLQARGARVLPSLAALGALAPDFVFINVSDSAALRSLVAGDDGLAARLPVGSVVIDNSSVAPETAREMAGLLAARGIGFLDAPVTGGTTGAAAGTLTVMVGGDAALARRCEPVLRAFAKSIHYLGPAGSGQACKLCHQVAAACAMLGLCEGLSLAAKGKLPVAAVHEVLAAGSVGSSIVRVQGARIVAGDHSPGFRLDLMRKDLRTAHDFAAQLNLPLPGSELVAAWMSALAQRDGGDLGWQALIREFEARGGFTFPVTEPLMPSAQT